MAGLQPQPSRPGLLRTVKAVAWSFVGLRRARGLEDDAAGIHPLQVLAVGLVAVFLLVLGLMALVRWIA